MIRQILKYKESSIEKLRSLSETLEKPSREGTCSLAFFGKNQTPRAFNVLNISHTSSLIIDSGATDHMTHSSHQFICYNPCPSNGKIAIANGTLIIVTGLGDILINKSLTLRNVLLVPRLSTNLISINKLA